jgi:hypothetical protein
MQNNLFTPVPMYNSTLTEIEISYKPKYKASELPKMVTSADAYGVLKNVFPNLDTGNISTSYA